MSSRDSPRWYEVVLIVLIFPLLIVLFPITMWRLFKSVEVHTNIHYNTVDVEALHNFVNENGFKTFSDRTLRHHTHQCMFRQADDTTSIWFSDKYEAARFKLMYTDNEIYNFVHRINE